MKTPHTAGVDPELQRLAQKLAGPARLVRAWELHGGISAGMTAFEVEAPGGARTKMVLRQPAAGALPAHDEFRLLQALQAEGLPTPAPILLGAAGDIFPAAYLVLAYIEGQAEFDPPNPVQRACQMADTLARIHAVAPSAAGEAFLPRQSGTRPELDTSPAAKRALDVARVRGRLAACPLPHPANPLALLHGDYWPGNVLWRDGRLAGIIDWEDAHLGDPLADFAIGRLDVLWIYGPDAFEAFSRQYLSGTAIDAGQLPYWDLYAALRLSRLVGADIDGWAGYFAPYGRPDITPQTIRAHFWRFVGRACDQLTEQPRRRTC